jgi:hypothetical protein
MHTCTGFVHMLEFGFYIYISILPLRKTHVYNTKQAGPRTFSSFVYVPSDYDAPRRQRAQEKAEHMALMVRLYTVYVHKCI